MWSDLSLCPSQEAVNYTSIGFPRNRAAKDSQSTESEQARGGRGRREEGEGKCTEPILFCWIGQQRAPGHLTNCCSVWSMRLLITADLPAALLYVCVFVSGCSRMWACARAIYLFSPSSSWLPSMCWDYGIQGLKREREREVILQVFAAFWRPNLRLA